MKIRSSRITPAQRIALRRRVSIKHWKGKPYAAKWPKPRGAAATPDNAIRESMFGKIARLTKFAIPTQQITARWDAKYTDQVWRDLVMSAAYGNYYVLNDSDGNVWRSWRSSLAARRQKLGIAALALLNTTHTGENWTTEASIQWDSVNFDTGPFWSASNPERFTIPANCNVVDLQARIVVNSGTVNDTAHYRIQRRRSDGTLLRAMEVYAIEQKSTFQFNHITWLHVPVNEGDYFQVRYSNWTDTSINMPGGLYNSSFLIRRVV